MDTDGKTAHERRRGRKLYRQLPDFGERVMFHKSTPKSTGEKVEPRLESRVYLVINEVSQELIMGTALGAVEANEFNRKGSEEERWNTEDVTAMKGLPWQSDPRTAGCDVKTGGLARASTSGARQAMPSPSWGRA